MYKYIYMYVFICMSFLFFVVSPNVGVNLCRFSTKVGPGDVTLHPSSKMLHKSTNISPGDRLQGRFVTMFCSTPQNLNLKSVHKSYPVLAQEASHF